MSGSVTGPTSTAAATGATGAGPSAFDRLGKQDFLKLLVAQLRNQDPMKPMEDKEFIAQLAQFSSLESLQNLNTQLESFLGAQQLTQAASLLGKNVQATLADGTTLSGVVKEVQVVGGKPQLLIGAQTVNLSQIVKVGS